MKRTVTINYNLKNDYNDLIKLGKNYRSDINYFYSRFSGIKNLNNLNFRTIRDNELKDLNHLKFKGHYLQRCLNSALGNIKSMWTKTLNQIKVNITSNEKLTEQEKHFLYIVIKSNTFVDYIVNTTYPFDSLLNNKYFQKWREKYSSINLNEKKLRNYLKRQIRKLKPKIPYTRKNNQIKINTLLYRFSKDKLKVTNSYKKRNRFQLVSKNKNVYKSEGTLIVENNNIKVHFPIDVKQRSLNGENIIGIDKGYNKLITVSSNHVYGNNYSNVVKPFIDKYLNTQKERNRYWTLYHKYKEVNPKKASNIKKYNLGYKKFNRNKNLLKETKKKFINKAINDLIKFERPKEIFLEDLKWSKQSKTKIDNDIENKKQELNRLKDEIEKYNNLIASKGLINKDYNIYELNFSIRTTNCLVRANIDSLEKLVKYTLNGEILKVRTLGKKCYFEILDKLQELKIIKYDNSSNKVDDVQKTIQLVRRAFVYIKVTG